MAKHNYSQYSKKKSKDEATNVTETEVNVSEMTVNRVVESPRIDDLISTAAEVKMEPKLTTGIVTGCSKLNVRSEPETTADILCVLNSGSEVKIDRANSTEEWFKITNAAGIDGYCMRKFVKI